jgi:hypothetical protein
LHSENNLAAEKGRKKFSFVGKHRWVQNNTVAGDDSSLE